MIDGTYQFLLEKKNIQKTKNISGIITSTTNAKKNHAHKSYLGHTNDIHTIQKNYMPRIYKNNSKHLTNKSLTRS